MSEKNITKISDIENSLTKTGFIFEMEVAEFFKESGFIVDVNNYFLDLEEFKKREIDIIATKKINNIVLCLIIECKQSLEDDWVFICSEAKPPRYYYAIKHLPSIYDLNKTKVFEPLNTLNRKIPLAQNYIALKKKKGQKAQANQIDECLHKLPKALIYEASRRGGKSKSIYLSIVIFNGQMFSASFNKKLIVKERGVIQYNVNFESDFYSENTGRPFKTISMNPEVTDDYRKTQEIKGMIETAKLLRSYFQIDFITKEGLSTYIKNAETEIERISTKKWSFNIKK